MDHFKFEIFSKFPCLVFCENNFVGEADEKTSVKINLDEKQSKRIEVYPKSTKDVFYFIPYAFMLSNQINSSQNFMCYDLLDGNFEIDLNPKIELHMPMSFDKIFEEEKGETKICVQSSTLTKIVLENKKNKIEFCPKQRLDNIICKTHSCGQRNYFVLTAKTISNQQYLFLVCLDNIDYCIEKTCDDITFDLPEISTLKLCHDFYEHAQIEKYKLAEDGLKKLESFSSRKEQKSFSTPQRKDISKVFFQCIKMHDYELARIFMTKQLSELLSDQHLSHFFPKFREIKLAPNRDVVLLVGDQTTYFHLSFLDNKIDNIEILER